MVLLGCCWGAAGVLLVLLSGGCWANIKMHTGKQADHVSAKRHHMLHSSFVFCHVLIFTIPNKVNGLSAEVFELLQASCVLSSTSREHSANYA